MKYVVGGGGGAVVLGYLPVLLANPVIRRYLFRRILARHSEDECNTRTGCGGYPTIALGDSCFIYEP